jgi:coenzyme Q-binding protein COQ10
MASAERVEKVDVPFKKLFDVIADFSSYPKFVSGMKAVREEAPNAWFFDVEMVKRVQYVLQFDKSLDESKGHGTIKWTLKQSEFFKKNNGLWEIKSLGPSQSEVKYLLDVEFNFYAPSLVLKGLVGSAVPKTIKDFVAEAKGRSA